jgi:large subunit ribosomal protein L30
VGLSMAKDAKLQRIRVELIRSTIGRLPAQRKTVRALGLGRIGSSNELDASDAVRGMVHSVSHLVKVEELD